MKTTRQAAPPAALRYCGLVGLPGLIVFFAVLLGSAAPPFDNLSFWLLAAGVLIAELFPLKIPRRGDNEEVTLSTSFSYALLIVAGLPAAILAQGAASTLQDAFARKPLWRIVFNVGQYTLAFAAADLVLRALSVHPGLSPATLSPRDLGVTLFATAVSYALNVLLVGVGVALYQRAKVLDYLRQDLAFIAVLGAVLVSLAVVLVAALHYSRVLVPLMIAPLWLVHRFAEQSGRLQHEALHDGLTQLPNRVRFREVVNHTIEHGGHGTRVAVMLIDLDRFKEINDTLGHHYGDRLLAQAGPRLAAGVRGADVVARLGGDEFAVFLRDLPDGPDTALRAAERLRETLSEPFELDGFVVEVDSSIGIALYPEDGQRVDSLLRRADIAMYRAKQTGDGQLLYSREFDDYSPARLALIGDLHQAVDGDGLVVWYQPKLDLRSGRISGVEALVRWRHPTLGMLQPSAFIELAEHTGLIKPLTERVLDIALRDRRQWLAEGIELAVAVNVSARSLHDRAFAGNVTRLIEAYSVPPEGLKLEVTESSIMSEPRRASAAMEELRTLGVRFSVDDFGTGYTSLSHLLSLPVDEIKLDKGFVLRMASSSGDAVIVRSTIELGRNLGLRVVAEGVEDSTTMSALRDLGCHEVQGFAVAHPLPGPELAAWMRRRGEARGPASVTPLRASP